MTVDSLPGLPPSSRLVFVAGLHRSGTSLLHRSIGCHPAVSTFSGTGAKEDEGQLLQTVYPPAASFGGPGKFGFDERSFLTERSPLATPAHARALWSDWSPLWDLSCDRLVEKSPPNLVRMRFLQALFPDPYFIVVLRHPVAVSYATQKWAGTRLHRLIEHWLVCHERFASDRPHVRRLHVLRYEDLVDRFDETMGEVFRFLDLPEVPIAADARTGVNDRYFQRYRQLASGGLRRSAYVRYIRTRFGARARAFGYSLDPDQLEERVEVRD